MFTSATLCFDLSCSSQYWNSYRQIIIENPAKIQEHPPCILMYPANPKGIPTVAACLKMLSERCNTLVLQLGGRKRKTAFLNGCETVGVQQPGGSTPVVHHCCPGAVQLVLHNAPKSFHFLRVPTNPRPSPVEKNHITVKLQDKLGNGKKF